MNQLLKKGQVIQLDNGESCKVKDFLGSGGQGEVYSAELKGQSAALKWYFPQNATNEQHAALEELLKIGTPSAIFLFPLHLTSFNPGASFGYLMPLRQPNYKNTSDLLKRRIEPSFRHLLIATIQLVDGFAQLHAKGLCYRDISFSNFFIDPDTGDILICDNDNVAVNNTQITGVVGTPRFMAPEIVRRDANPNSDSDRFSLAVLLFYLLMLHHPLEGKKEADIKCMDLPAMNKLFGSEPLFIFDPNNTSNRPVPGYQDNALVYWQLYPQFIKEIFTRSFTNGLRDVNSRVRESEWLRQLLRLKDAIIDCSCGAENFYEQEALKDNDHIACWSCQQQLILPPRIRIKHSLHEMTVMLNNKAELYPYHLYPARNNELSPALAQVVQHPHNPNIWGLKNLNDDPWTFTENGILKTVEHGKSVTLTTGITINFGQATAEIRT